jgi:serine O-acetyltransferase
VRRDWAHYVRVRGEAGPLAYLAVPFENPSLIALWIYRYGYWSYTRRSRWMALPHKALYQLLYLAGQVLFKIALDPTADIEDDVWLAPGGNILVGHSARIGAGSFLHGCNTLGLVAGTEAMPQLGQRVHVGPGTMLVGPVEVPDDTVLGPNSIVIKSVPQPGAWSGTPLRPYAGPALRLVPTVRSGRSARTEGRRTIRGDVA